MLDYDAQLKIIKRILENAKVPKSWYYFPKDDADHIEEARFNIVSSPDGIRIFNIEKGACRYEKTFKNWRCAIMTLARQFELKYTEKVIAETEKYLKNR